MTTKLFQLFDGINREGLNNQYWTLVEDFNTEFCFGTIESLDLHGRWLALYLDNSEEYYSFIHGVGLKPNYRLPLYDSDTVLELYKL